MNSSLPFTIKDLLEGYKKKKFSPQEIVNSFYNRSKELTKVLNHFNYIRSDIKEVPSNPIPSAHKDMFNIKNMPTTASSRILENYVSPYTATAVERLEKENFYTLGKLNCDAFAHGGTGENSDFGPAKNPYNLEHVPGGSSSGSAVAVATGSVLMALGTDTGGSVRNPASYTNTVGLKPTYGLVSRYGVVAMTSSTDSIGHITRTVWDSAYVLNITAGKDVKDATTLQNPVKDYTKDLDSYNPKGLKVGLPKEYFSKDINPKIVEKVQEFADILKAKGAIIKEVSLPNTSYGIPTYYVITPSEVSSNLARYDGIRYGKDRSFFGDENARRIMIGTFALSSGYYDAYYAKAQRLRNAISQDFSEAFKEVDILLTPVVPDLPPKIGEVLDDPIKNYLLDVLTVNVNLAGLPGLSIPAGFVGDFPVGAQLIGPKLSEHLLFKVGSVLEKETEYYKITPKI